jgi:hypothetical protein
MLLGLLLAEGGAAVAELLELVDDDVLELVVLVGEGDVEHVEALSDVADGVLNLAELGVGVGGVLAGLDADEVEGLTENVVDGLVVAAEEGEASVDVALGILAEGGRGRGAAVADSLELVDDDVLELVVLVGEGDVEDVEALRDVADGVLGATELGVGVGRVLAGFDADGVEGLTEDVVDLVIVGAEEGEARVDVALGSEPGALGRGVDGGGGLLGAPSCPSRRWRWGSRGRRIG